MAFRFEMIKNPKFDLTKYMDSPTHVKITEVSGYNKSTFRYFTKLSQDQLGNETTHTTYTWYIKWKKCAGMGLNGFKLKKKKSVKEKKNPGSRLGSIS